MKLTLHMISECFTVKDSQDLAFFTCDVFDGIAFMKIKCEFLKYPIELKNIFFIYRILSLCTKQKL